MKVLSAQQIREADAFTIKNEPVASIDLMERACVAFVDKYNKNLDLSWPIWIFCGIGNNGGDGLGIARLLHRNGCDVRVYIAGDRRKGSDDFQTNLKRIQGVIEVLAAEAAYKAEPPPKLVVIDALFGSGLNRPLTGDYPKLIEFLNKLAAFRLAVDVPSGLFCDQPQGTAVTLQADLTITFQVPKLAFLLPENHRAVGKWEVVDVGLSKEFIDNVSSNYFYQQVGDKELRLPSRDTFMHKGQAGRTLLLAGGKGKVGAAILSSKACMMAGAGLLTLHTPRCAVVSVHTSVPEAMIDEDHHTEHIADTLIDTSSFDCIAIGPGIGTHGDTKKALEHVLHASSSRPMVLDADALNILSEDNDLLKLVPANSILTPHPGEFKRLVGEWSNDYERLEKQVHLSQLNQLIIVLKGAHTSISTPDGKVFFNSTGNPGMATAGSGDVLTGVVAGLLSQGFSPEKSARLAVLIHGISGDLASERVGEYSLIASDIVNSLPLALIKMQNDDRLLKKG